MSRNAAYLERQKKRYQKYLKKKRTDNQFKEDQKFQSKKFRRFVQKAFPFIAYYDIYIQSTYKQTLIFLYKNRNQLLKQWSTRSLKKLDIRKNSLYNVQQIIYQLNDYILLKKLRFFRVFFKGRGYGKRSFFKNFLKKKKNIRVLSIHDIDSMPFNGCRPKKEKRR